MTTYPFMTKFSYYPSMVFLPVQPPHWANVRWNRCHDLNSCPLENWRRSPGRPHAMWMKSPARH